MVFSATFLVFRFHNAVLEFPEQFNPYHHVMRICNNTQMFGMISA
jgi:hypothetical protein